MRRFLHRHWSVLLVTLLALAVRVAWNVAIHPPHAHIYSDMGGYFDRALEVAEKPLLEKHDGLSFFPWGTHAFFGLVRMAFVAPGTCTRTVNTGCWPLSLSVAVLGALAVFYVTLLARQLAERDAGDAAQSRWRRWFHVVVGLLAALYLPFVAQSSFFMSEPPFALCLSAFSYHLLRLVDDGEARDALWAGTWAGLGAIVRAQLLMSLVFIGAFLLWRRRHLAGPRLKLVMLGAAPLAAILAFSAVRTTRHHREGTPGAFALVATNDALNYAFGRCHAIGIEARKRGYSNGFGPPALGALYRHGRRYKDAWFTLEPALPPDKRCRVNKEHAAAKEPLEPCILFQGTMQSRGKLAEIARECVARVGYARQAWYAVTNVVLLFGYNRLWPMQDKEIWRDAVNVMEIGFRVTLLPLGAVGAALGLRRRGFRRGLLGMHLVAIVCVSAIFFGETRLRVPYDAIAMVLGLDVLGRVARWTADRLKHAAFELRASSGWLR